MKKYILACTVLDLLSIILIPFDLFLMDIPQWTGLIVILMIVLANILLWIKVGEHDRAKIAVSAISLFCSAAAFFGTFCNPYWNSLNYRINADINSMAYDHVLTKEEALQDLGYAVNALERLHPAFYKNTPEEYSLRCAEIKEILSQSDSVTAAELNMHIETIFSSLSDGHTYVRMNPSDRRVLKYYREWTNAGYSFDSVNGISIEKLFENKSALYSYEVESWAYEWLYDDIVTIAGLNYLGFDTNGEIEYTLTSESGEIRTEKCSESDFLLWDEYAEYNKIEGTYSDDAFVSYKIDKENNIAILKLDSCRYNNEYISCVKDMFSEVRDNDIKNVAVDIRANGGGSDQVITEFLRYIDIDSYKIATMGWRLGPVYLELGSGTTKNSRYDDLMFDGDLYLLTSAGSFSSAMMFAEYVKDNHIGTIIGEAPGNVPDGYGEIAYFTLPNSKLFMQISTKHFYRADRECTDKLVLPDVPCSSDRAEDELYKIIQ